MKKINVILDTIIITSYSHKDEKNIAKGIDLSFNVCKKIFKLCNADVLNMIFKVSIVFFQNGYLESNNTIRRMK